MKPLGRKNYGSIGHLPGSRMGPADHMMPEGQLKIATEKVRDKHDLIIVTEKLDGSNVGIARIGDKIVALQRAGFLAALSPFSQHHLFADWVKQREDIFRAMLQPGERLVGEWMAQAHGTRYSLPQGPFAAFDLMIDDKRAPYRDVLQRAGEHSIPVPKLIAHHHGPISIAAAMEVLGQGDHGCLEEPEGAVWRVERRGEFDFMGKWVRPNKKDGSYLPEVTGENPVWNWRPTEDQT